MKKTFKFIAAAAFAAAFVGCSSEPTYTISGSDLDLDGTIYVLNEDREVIDSVLVENGAFTYEGKYEVPAMYSLSAAKEGRSKFNVGFFVEPGVMTVSPAEGAGPGPARWQVAGTPANDASIAYNKAMSDFYQKYREASEEDAEALDLEYEKINADYFEANTDNYFGAYLLSREYSYEYTGQQLLDAVNSFPEELQQGKILVRQRELAEQRIKTDVGNPYIEVSQKDPEGNEILLSSVIENPANKYVLIDFWASWCGPCMGEVPVMKKTYDAFHDKGFEIYGISFDTDHDKWVNCIKDRELNWVHVSDLNRFDNQACRDYTIVAIPSNVLVDANGTVVAKQLRGEALYNKVAELLSE